MNRRRIKVVGIDAVATALISVLAGLLVLTAGASPTGDDLLDRILVFLLSAGVVWMGASANWWVGVVAAAVGAAFAPSWLMVLLGVAAAGGGLAIGLLKRSVPYIRALVAGAALIVLSRLGTIIHFGASAIIAGVISALIVIAGLVRRSRKERRIVVSVLGTIAGLMFLAVVGVAIAGASARPDLENGNTAARQGIDQLRQGDFTAATTSFRRAGDLFAKADDTLSAIWSQPSRLVPGVAQNRNAVAELVHGASTSVAQIVAALGKIDLDKLKLVGGRIDIDAVKALHDPLVQLSTTLHDLDATAAKASTNRWVVHALTAKLGDLRKDIAKQEDRLDNAISIVGHAPSLLGAEGTRVYFVAFMTPSEIRGSLGFMGNFAELTIENGKISVSKFGRHDDLTLAGAVGQKTITGSEQWLAHWGPYGIQNADGTAANHYVWENITLSPNFPDTAKGIAELYPQSGGRQIDGVIGLDVTTLATLLQITGPISVEGMDAPLDASNAADFLLRGQYLTTQDNANRVDTLALLAQATVNKIFEGSLPSPPKLANLLAPMVAQGRLVGWASRTADEDVFVRAKMAGAIPTVPAGDTFTFSLVNAAGSKIDAYTEGQATYDVRTDPATGKVHATATLVIRNAAPSGLPEVVTGNRVGLATGTNRTIVSIYSALSPTTMSIDDQPVDFAKFTEGSLKIADKFVEIPLGQSVKVTVELDGTLDLRGGYAVVLRSPPLAHDFPMAMTVDGKEAAKLDKAGTATVTVPRG